ncbi:MAG: type II toxin-antitoxin system VapC family toxin [Candidatus Electrothrix sp. Rat3]|nr:type II toxin-antitoxin system VapC family toxin [Candidatus Electrothrix rattekaaiensis]
MNVYVETSIISYLTARPTNDIRAAAHQNATLEWWSSRRSEFTLYISEFVTAEAAEGNAEAANRRLTAIADLQLLQATPEVMSLAEKLLHAGALPRKAYGDAFHIAISAVHGMDYLLTWNCKHIANAVMRPKIEAVCMIEDYAPPIICTPEELMSEE